MNIKSFKPLFKLLGLVVAVFALNACSSEPSPWTKNESPWDQRRASNSEVPESEEYKSDLDMQTEEDLAYPVEPMEETVVTEEYAVEEEPPAEPVAGGNFQDIPANYYTVQLMASVDIDRVYRFADKNQLSTQYVVPTLRDGLTWHVLLLDVYPDYASAVAGRDEIADLLNTQPWVRKVGSVQRLMQ